MNEILEYFQEWYQNISHACLDGTRNHFRELNTILKEEGIVGALKYDFEKTLNESELLTALLSPITIPAGLVIVPATICVLGIYDAIKNYRKK